MDAESGVEGGDEGAAPELVRSRVRFVHRGLASVRLVESAAFALAALTSGLAAAVVSGAELSEAGAWWAAGLCGLLAGLAWAIQHRQSAHQVARQVDRTMGFGGALFTAFEVEGREETSELGRLLARSVAGRADARRMLRLVLPGSAPLFALPFAGAVLLFLAQEEARLGPRLGDLGLLTSRVESALGEFAHADAGGTPPPGEGDLAPEELAELASLARAAGSLGRPAPEEGAEEALDKQLAELQRRMTELEERLPAANEVRRQLERVADTLDSARMALEGPAPAPGGEGSGGAAGASGGAGAGEQPGTALVPGVKDGTMSGYPLPEEIENDPRESGVIAGRGWSEAYDGIVSRWVAAHR